MWLARKSYLLLVLYDIAILLHLEVKVVHKPKQFQGECLQYTERDYWNGLFYDTQQHYYTKVSYNGTK